MRRFRKFRDDRFALTTLQNPNIELRTYAELVQAAQQERQNQPAPAQIPSSQEQPAPVVPCAPDSIPAAQFQEMDESTAPDPLRPAPLDSTNPDAANSDPRIEAVRQLAASLGIPVFVETSTLPAVEADVASQPGPKPRPKTKSRPKSKSRRKSNPPPPAENQELEEEDLSALTSVERQSRKCNICRHPERQSIDDAFLHWRSPKTIMHCFDIPSETTIYDHAHAFNFFALPNRNLQSALANIIEDIDRRDFTGSEMLDAVRALAHLNENGRWIHPTSKSEVIYSMQRLPAGTGLPAAQAALPAYPNALPAGQPAAAGQPILISSDPGLENDAND
jgi:hypothetical protein